MWKVERHGGRRNDKWRRVIETPDESKARRCYEREEQKMRQGKVVLVNPEGKVVKSAWAPRHWLKSSW